MVKRPFRLTRSTDFMRVRRSGRSYAHPLLLLVALRNNDQSLRIGITAGKSVGGAVQRNRAKRLLRAAAHAMQPTLNLGWDLILIARPALLTVEYPQIKAALRDLFVRANLLE